MILGEPHGLAEHDDERPFGCPYHGVVQDGQLTLPNGETMDYPQPTDYSSHPGGRVLALSPPWAEGGNPSEEDVAAGRTWPATAFFAGGRLQYGGRDVGSGVDDWIYLEAKGKSWVVTPMALTPSDQPSSVTFRLSRFGHLGPLPDEEGEAEREISIEIPATRPSWEVLIPAGTANRASDTVIPGAYPYVKSYKSGGKRSWTSVMFVSDVSPGRGSQAILLNMVAPIYTTGGVVPTPILSATLVDLEAGTAESLYLHDPVPHRIPDPETYFLDQTPDYQVPVSGLVSTTPFSCALDGEPMQESVYEYTHTETRSDTINGGGENGYELRQETLLLAAGFTQWGNVDLVTLRSKREYSAVFDQNLSYSGQRVVHGRPEGSEADCPTGEIEDTRTISWGMTTTRSDVRELVIQSTARGVLHEYTSRRDQVTHCVPCTAPLCGTQLVTDSIDTTESGNGPRLQYREINADQGDVWPDIYYLRNIEFDYILNTNSQNVLVLSRLGVAVITRLFGEYDWQLYHTRIGSRDPAAIIGDVEYLDARHISIHPVTGEIVSNQSLDRVWWV